jgi:uncharacterized protein (DUF433 family)
MRDRIELLNRISIDPRVCVGRPVIRGTRIEVSLIIENLSEGVSEAELLAAYPQLKSEDIRAALALAAAIGSRANHSDPDGIATGMKPVRHGEVLSHN